MANSRVVSRNENEVIVSGGSSIIAFEMLNATSARNDELPSLSTKLRSGLVVLQLSGNTLFSSVINGLIVVGLLKIRQDLDIPTSLSFWPASVSGLATASTLLLAGSLADIIGSRWVKLLGNFSNGAMIIGMSVSTNGTQLIVLRALLGVGLSLHFSSAVGILAHVLPQGGKRNIAFSIFGMSQPFGFSVGLVLGGVLIDTVGWRVGFYLCGGFVLFLSIVGFFILPDTQESRETRIFWYQMSRKVDWIGAIIASAFMALFCYLLAILSSNVNLIKEPTGIVILSISVIMVPIFGVWAHHQVKKGRPALIPNKLWRNAIFSSICITIAFSYSVVNSMELFASLFFQEFQQLSALQASIRLLPSLTVGVMVQTTTGFFVHRISAVWIVTIASFLCCFSLLLMAIAKPSTTYWENSFIAQILQPVHCSVLFPVGLIIITDIFPQDTKALAGAVFNTAAQFGSAFGLGIGQVVSTVITGKMEDHEEKTFAIMAGYRASFWAMFGLMAASTLISAAGLRKAGRIGLKRE